MGGDLTEPRPPLAGVAAALCDVGLGLLVVVGLGAWAIGILWRPYDYDEVQRAHAIWLTAQGLRPYHDFFECHPPYFVLLSPIVRWCADPCDLLRALRLVAAAGNLLFLGGLAALATTALQAERRWAWLGLAVVAFHPHVLIYLVEFRIDGWGYALAVWSLYRFLRRPHGARRWVEMGCLTGIASVLFCPKLALLPPLLVVFEPMRQRRPLRDFLRVALAYLLGVGLAALLIGGFLAANRIEVGRTFALLVRYHALSNTHAAIRHGLLQVIVQRRVLFVLVLAGAIGWIAACLRRRSPPEPYAAALIVWLGLQAALVSYPYKQYYAPWFLFASGLYPIVGQGLARVSRGLGVAAFVAACVATACTTAGAVHYWSFDQGLPTQEAVIRWMDRVSRPEDRVIALPPCHPIDRRDTFFVWLNTYDPNGHDTEWVLGRLPQLRETVSEARYRAELAAHPPALVVLGGEYLPVLYPPRQWAIVGAFLRDQDYRVVRVRDVEIAVRPSHLPRDGPGD